MGYRINEETIISNIRIKKINLDIAFKDIKQKFLNKKEKSTRINIKEIINSKNFEDLINGLRWVVEFDENGDCISFFNHSLNIAEEDFLFHSLAPYMENDSYIEYENETFIGNIKNIYRYKKFKVKHEVIEISDEKDNLSYF